MAKLIPPRPEYRKERLLAGFLALTAFVLLFAYRFLHAKGFLGTGALPVVLLMEAVVFLLPAVIYCAYRGRGFVKSLRLRPVHAVQLPLLISGFFALLFGCLLLSILCRGTGSLGNVATSFESPAPEGFLMGAARFFVLALFPALFEEFFFRGVLTAEYERRGFFRAILLPTILFAMIHLDLKNLPVYLFSGFLFSLVLFATDSLIATMILHTLYNTVSLFGQRYLNALYDFTGSVELFLFFLILFFLIALLVFCRQAMRLYRIYERAGTPNPRRNIPYAVQFYTTLDALRDPAFLLCIALFVAGVILA